MIDWQSLSHASRRQIAAIQNRRVRFLARHLLGYHPFYRRILKEEKINVNDIAAVTDLQQIPFTTKLDLLPTKNEPSKPTDFIFQPNTKLVRHFYPKWPLLRLLVRQVLGGENLTTELEHEFKPIHIHFTTGRSTDQIPFFYTDRDLRQLCEVGRRIFDIIGATDNDIVVNAFPFAPHLAFWLTYNTLRDTGLLSLHTGGGKILGTDKTIDAIEKLRATILIIIPGFGYHLLREAALQKRDLSSLRIVLFGGERVSPGLRDKVREYLHQMGAKKVKILSSYALTESKVAWVQCHEDSGYHLYPDLERIDLVDEQGKPVPEGTRGEVVYTGLNWRGSSVVRYRTGDWCQGLYEAEPCKYCGRTVPRLHYDIERQSELLELHLTKVKGQLVNLNAFYSIVHRVAEIEEWQVEVKKRNNDPYDLDQLVVHVSLQSGVNRDNALHHLDSLIKHEVGITPIIEVHEPDALLERLGLERELKEKRIVDLRKQTKAIE